MLQRADIPERALFGVRSHGARVYNNDVGAFGAFGEFIAHTKEHPAQFLTVRLVLLAAKRFNVRQRGRRARRVGRPYARRRLRRRRE
jgi:hypothetical protein